MIQLFGYCSIKPNIQFNIVGTFAGDVDPDVLAGYGYYPSTTDQPPVCPDYPDFTGPSGTITSPGWPGDYPANSGCYWVIDCGVQGVFPKVSVHWGAHLSKLQEYTQGNIHSQIGS